MAYANNVKCMYNRVPVHIVDCNGFIGGIYTDIELPYVDINLLAYVVYMSYLKTF